MTQQIPSPNDTKAYTALAIQCFSGSFFGENFTRCTSDKPEDAYYAAVVDMVFDMDKLDYFQKEPLPEKKNPYTLLSATINIQQFNEANKMLDALLARNPTPEQIVEALDVHHSREMLKKVLFTKKHPYPTDKFQRGEAKRFIDRIREALPRKLYITEVLGQQYSHEMAKEDADYEHAHADIPTAPALSQPLSFAGTTAPVRKVATAPADTSALIQGCFTHLLFRE